MPLVEPVYTRYHWATQRILAGYTGTPPEKSSWKLTHIGVPLDKLWLLLFTLEHHWRDHHHQPPPPPTPTTHHTHTHIQAHIVKQSSIHASLKCQGDGPQAASVEVSVNSVFIWRVLLSNAYQFCCSNVSVLQHHSVHALDMGTIVVLCIWYCSTNEIGFSQTNLDTPVLCIRGSCWEVIWPNDFQTRPSQYWDTTGQITLEPHWLMLSPSDLPVAIKCLFAWSQHTGRPPEPHLHWDATGTTLADVITQWSSSGNPVLICIIGTHRRRLEDHWEHTENTLATNNSFSSGIPVYTGSKFQAHWIATGLPLNYHWLRVRDMWYIIEHIILILLNGLKFADEYRECYSRDTFTDVYTVTDNS